MHGHSHAIERTGPFGHTTAADWVTHGSLSHLQRHASIARFVRAVTMAVRRKRKRHTNDASHANDKDPADWTDAELKVDCPICLSLVYQPVIVPCCGSVLWYVHFGYPYSSHVCQHVTCACMCSCNCSLSCLEEGLAKSASSCPFCRQRLATWARKTKDKVGRPTISAVWL